MVWNQRIKALRESSHLTLMEISKRLGVSEATAQRYESDNGIKNIPYEQIIGYARIFNVSPSYIMGWEDAPSPAIPDLSDQAIQIAIAYDRADARGKIGAEVALGVNFTSEAVEPGSSGLEHLRKEA